MCIKRKRNYVIEKSSLEINTYLPSFNLRCKPYIHSKKFIKDGKNPEMDEMKRLKKYHNIDDLHTDLRKNAIHADTNREITYLKAQYTDHISDIPKIVAMCESDLAAAETNLKLVNEEIAEYEKEIERLQSLL